MNVDRLLFGLRYFQDLLFVAVEIALLLGFGSVLGSASSSAQNIGLLLVGAHTSNLIARAWGLARWYFRQRQARQESSGN